MYTSKNQLTIMHKSQVDKHVHFASFSARSVDLFITLKERIVDNQQY